MAKFNETVNLFGDIVNIQETPGYNQKENVKKIMLINNKSKP